MSSAADPETFPRDCAASLAASFAERAASFIQSADAAIGVDSEVALHAASIAIELSLKAVILHRGGSDERNRRELGHHLDRACRWADVAGFVPSPRLRAAADRLSPFYATHRLATLARSLDGSEVRDLVAVAAEHVAEVGRWLNVTGADCGTGGAVRQQ